MTEDCTQQIEAAIAAKEAAGQPWTNRSIYDSVGRNYTSLFQYLKFLRVGATRAGPWRSLRPSRRWIGIDVTHLAIALLKHRLHDTFGPDLAPYDVIGVPEDLASAEALAQQSRYQFEWSALGLVDARPAQDKKKGADRGVDGHIYFFDDNSGKAKQIIAQVQSGNVSVPQVRDLVGVLQREKAAIGLFLTLREPTKPMLQEAAGAGFYVPAYFPDQRFPRLQILTIAELLQGKSAQSPRYAPTATFRQASRRQQDVERQQTLL